LLNINPKIVAGIEATKIYKRYFVSGENLSPFSRKEWYKTYGYVEEDLIEIKLKIKNIF